MRSGNGSRAEGAPFSSSCGEARKMAKDVDAALRKIVQDKGGERSVDEANEYVEKLKSDKRYKAATCIRKARWRKGFSAVWGQAATLIGRVFFCLLTTAARAVAGLEKILRPGSCRMRQAGAAR